MAVQNILIPEEPGQVGDVVRVEMTEQDSIGVRRIRAGSKLLAYGKSLYDT
jgi:hypothetical protein